jgi:hypothetical protein
MADSMLHVSTQPITVDPSIAAFLNQLSDAGFSLEEPDRILMPYFESGLRSSTRQGRDFQHWWKWIFCCSWRRVQMVEVRTRYADTYMQAAYVLTKYVYCAGLARDGQNAANR